MFWENISVNILKTTWKIWSNAYFTIFKLFVCGTSGHPQLTQKKKKWTNRTFINNKV